MLASRVAVEGIAEQLGGVKIDSHAAGESSGGGFRSDHPWRSDLPPDFSTSDPESSDDEGEYWVPSQQNTYSSATKHLLPPDTAAQAASIIVAPSAGLSQERRKLCPFGMQGSCKFGERCRILHGLMCPVCGKLCLHPEGSQEEHDGIVRLLIILGWSVRLTCICSPHIRMFDQV